MRLIQPDRLNPHLLAGIISSWSGASSTCLDLDELAEGLVSILNTNRPAHVECLFTGELELILKKIKQGDPYPSVPSVKVERVSEEGGVRVSREGWAAPIDYTPREWVCFLGGVKNGEFDRLASTPSKHGSYEEAMEAFVIEVMKGNKEIAGNKKIAPLVTRIKEEQIKSAV